MDLIRKLHNLQEELRLLYKGGVPELALEYHDLYLQYKSLKQQSLLELQPHQYFQIADCATFLFPFGLRSIYNYLFHLKDIAEKEKTVEVLNKIEESYVEGGSDWRNLFLEIHLYFAFQSPYREDVHDFRSDISIDLGNLLDYYPSIQVDRARIWSHVNKKELKQIKNPNQYYHSESAFALDLLVCDGDKAAFDYYHEITMRIYNQKDEVLHSHISNVKSYLNSLGYEGERRKFLFNIGNKWEKICYEIAQHYYGKTIKHPILTNNKIPDLLPVAKDLTWENGKLKYAPLSLP